MTSPVTINLDRDAYGRAHRREGSSPGIARSASQREPRNLMHGRLEPDSYKRLRRNGPRLDWGRARRRVDFPLVLSKVAAARGQDGPTNSEREDPWHLSVQT